MGGYETPKIFIYFIKFEEIRIERDGFRIILSLRWKMKGQYKSYEKLIKNFIWKRYMKFPLWYFIAFSMSNCQAMKETYLFANNPFRPEIFFLRLFFPLKLISTWDQRFKPFIDNLMIQSNDRVIYSTRLTNYSFSKTNNKILLWSNQLIVAWYSQT